MNSSSFLMFCTYKKLAIEILNLSSFKICESIKMITNVSVMCIEVHEMWDIPCIWFCDFYKLLKLLPKATPGHSEANLVSSADPLFCDEHRCDFPAF
jgi:hypothetical protein